MPGSFTPTAHWSEPSTFGGMSKRRGDWPTILSSWTVLTFAMPAVASMSLPVSATLNRFPPISSPYVTRRDGSFLIEMTPSLTARRSDVTPNRVAAISSSTRRASAATRRIGQPSVCSASEPPEPP